MRGAGAAPRRQRRQSARPRAPSAAGRFPDRKMAERKCAGSTHRAAVGDAVPVAYASRPHTDGATRRRAGAGRRRPGRAPALWRRGARARAGTVRRVVRWPKGAAEPRRRRRPFAGSRPGARVTSPTSRPAVGARGAPARLGAALAERRGSGLASLGDRAATKSRRAPRRASACRPTSRAAGGVVGGAAAAAATPAAPSAASRLRRARGGARRAPPRASVPKRRSTARTRARTCGCPPADARRNGRSPRARRRDAIRPP